MNILLICFSGMSTGILSIRMKEAAAKIGLDLTIKAVPVSEVEANAEGIEFALVGPQLKYALSGIEDQLKGIPVMCVEARDYGVMNGEKVLADLLEKFGTD